MRRRTRTTERDAIRRGLPVSAAARRRTQIIGGLGGASFLVLTGAEAVRVWRLGTLPLSRGDDPAGTGRLGSPVRAARVLRQGYRVSQTRENVVFNMVASFVWTFGWARGITYAIRTRGHLGPIRNVTTSGGRHIHHFIPGMVIAFVAGGAGIASRREEMKRWLALPFGMGVALVLDETALLLELEDVYWSEEGVLSVQAAFSAVGLLAALAYAYRVASAGKPSAEADWQTAARAFDDLQLLPGHGS